MKKLLFVRTRPLESNTSSSIRAISTIELLQKCGYEVTVLTTNAGLSSNDYKIFEYVSKMIRIPMSGTYESMRKVKKTDGDNRKSLKSTIIVELKKLYRKLVIIDPLKSSVSNLAEVLPKLEKKYDVIASCSDPKSSHILAQEVIKLGIQCGKYIQFWGDPLYHDISRKYYVPKFIVWRKEYSLMRLADLVYYVSPFTLESQKKTFPNCANKMKCLFPAYQKERIYEPVKKVSKIGYYGDYLSQIRNLKPLYEAVKVSDFQLEIFGASDIDLDSLENISVNGRIPREEVTRREGEADMLVCLCNSTGSQIPGKLYQYASTNKPILIINDGDINLESCFGKYGRFIFCDNNVHSITKALDMISNSNFEALKPLYDFSVDSQVKQTQKEIE